jgi:hypothetical protein
VDGKRAGKNSKPAGFTPYGSLTFMPVFEIAISLPRSGF